MAGDDEDPLICHCMMVTESTIRAAIRDGAHTVEAVQDTTYASAGCGTCVFDVFRLLREAGFPQPHDPDVPTRTDS